MIKYKVVLNATEQSELEQITSQGKHSARKIKRAQILLMSHAQTYTDEAIAELLLISQSTIHRTRLLDDNYLNRLTTIRIAGLN